MTETRLCSRCGAPLPAGSDECPRCLLRLGLQLPSRDPSGPPTAGAPGAPSPRPVALPLEEVARRFPQLEILGLVGQGGMGVVYRARQPRLDRVVALKILPPELSADGDFAERFLREARAMARLSHPHIVAVHDFGESDGLCWLVMEFVDGVNLREALKGGQLTPERALAVVPQMCDALQYAHDEGVVHRDIKPENVLLDRQGRVRIADFGLAKLVGPQDVTLTGERQVFGTPHYMAPEQMEAARDVDHRADIFSLGVVFYEMLTGRLPLGHFEPPSRRVAVDVRVDEIVLHALEHEPQRRYQHAVDVKTDVESVARGGAPQAARDDASGVTPSVGGAGGGAGGGPPGTHGAGAGPSAGATAGVPGGSTAAGAALKLLLGLVLLDFAAAIFLREDLLLLQSYGDIETLQNSAVGSAIVGLLFLWYGIRRLFEAEGSEALGDPQAVGLELATGMTSAVAVAALLGGVLGGFESLPAALAGMGGALLAAEAACLWLLRRWARRNPSHGRAVALPFERRGRAEREKQAARHARRVAQGKDSDFRILAGLVVGRRPHVETAEGDAQQVLTPAAAEPTPPATEPAAAKRSRWHGLYVLWIGASMVVWPAAAWYFAGLMASTGWDGVAAGAALLAATAWSFVQILVHSSPPLRDALRAEPAWLRALRPLVAWPLMVAGVLLLGSMVVERWEHGTQHYTSSSRSPQALFEGGRNQVGEALGELSGSSVQGFDRATEEAYYSVGSMPPTPEEAGAAGVLCLLGFAAACALRLPGTAGWDSCWRPVLLLPLLLLAGLKLAGVWSGLEHEAEHFPPRVSVAGEQRFAMTAERARSALLSALERAGLQQHAGQTAQLEAPAAPAIDKELGTEVVMAFEADEAWERWDLVDGLPLRRQPHVVVRIVGRGDACVVLWDCGEVSPVASEPLLWRTWMQRILGEAGGF